MPDLFKRTMLKICEGFEKKVKKKSGKSPPTLWNGNSRGVGGFKLNDHPWGDMDIFWNHTIDAQRIALQVLRTSFIGPRPCFFPPGLSLFTNISLNQTSYH